MGSGAHTYQLVEGWGKLPDGWTFLDVAAVAVDKRDQVYAFNRGKHPMIVFDRDGNFLRSWGEDIFKRAHGLHMGPDETIYCTDEGDHTVRQCTLEGKVLLQIGVPGKPAPLMSGEPFHRCTHTALSPRGDIYVSDGYGNARVHKYSPDGKLLMSWGEPGTDEGQFNLVHNICCDVDGWVYVADRENHRVQVFDGNGKYEAQWNNLHRPCGLFMPAGERKPICYIGELGPGACGQHAHAESRRPDQHRDQRRASCWRASARRSRARARRIHVAARIGGRFARRHLRGRGFVHVMATLPSGHPGAR
jgi:outer membrane protein assembly factor BamB